MNAVALREFASLAAEVGHVLVATADGNGRPHVAVAQEVVLDAAGRVVVSAWFCPGTVSNVRENRRVAFVAWNAQGDRGFQVLGTVEEVQEAGVLDGFTRAESRAPALPQVERRLLVRPDAVLAFTQAPHSDLPAT
jgi:pyridoxine/pyridoxamine 5'-phosphate oxidase